MNKIEYGRLLGFADLADAFGFRDEELSSRVGAKVGDGEPDGASAVVDEGFRSDAVASRIGAKVGPGEPDVVPGDRFRNDAVGARVGAKVAEEPVGADDGFSGVSRGQAGR